MNKFYTAQEVADKLKIKKTTVYDLIKRGELSSSKVGKQLRISEEQLEQYLLFSNRYCEYSVQGNGAIASYATAAQFEEYRNK